ncbi:Bestrophin-2 [Nymphon striatum]|nr:Bestrophin-2 [Nymphon striatum]
MTVSYTLEVSNAGLCGFAKLLLRWRGSIYKLMLKEMIMFIGLYYNLSIIYRYALSADGRIIFEKISIYCKAFSNLIPISFVLGFYVAIVVHRWWEQVLSVPSPDKYRSRIIRRTLIRYVNLTIVMTFQLISTAVKKRFPTIDHIQEAGLMTNEERSVYDVIVCPTGKWWVPIAWSCSLISRANKEVLNIALTILFMFVYTFNTFMCSILINLTWKCVFYCQFFLYQSTMSKYFYIDSRTEAINWALEEYRQVVTVMQIFIPNQEHLYLLSSKVADSYPVIGSKFDKVSEFSTGSSSNPPGPERQYDTTTQVDNMREACSPNYLEMWFYRKILKIVWTNKISNKEVIKRIVDRGGWQLEIMKDIKMRKMQYCGHIIRAEGLQSNILLGRLEGKRSSGRPRKKWLDDVKKWGRFTKVKQFSDNGERQSKVEICCACDPSNGGCNLDR